MVCPFYSINDQDKIISSTERSLLYIAIENNQFNKVKALLQHPKIDVNLTSFKKKDDIEEKEIIMSYRNLNRNNKKLFLGFLTLLEKN